ncbi:MAG: PEP-CTERM sorting domain-containing protein, partial [Planctomycetales bacterium]|nr:PEP-CTERM sorting domain-containing protein [Planctomycetales bacterium]
GAEVRGGVLVSGTRMQAGVWGAPGNGGATCTSSLLSGTGLLNVGGMAAQALAAVPEPASLVLLAGAAIALPLLRRRRETIR